MIQDTNKLKTAIAISVAILFFLFVFGAQLFPREIVNRVERVLPIQELSSSKLTEASLFASKNKLPEVQSRIGGLVQYVDYKEGFGPEVKEGSVVRFSYEGYLEETGQLFSQTNTGEVLEAVIGNGTVIPGIEIGLLGARSGGVRGIRLDSKVAYGETGSGPIPPNASVLFQVVIVEVINQQ